MNIPTGFSSVVVAILNDIGLEYLGRGCFVQEGEVGLSRCDEKRQLAVGPGFAAPPSFHS